MHHSASIEAAAPWLPEIGERRIRRHVSPTAEVITQVSHEVLRCAARRLPEEWKVTHGSLQALIPHELQLRLVQLDVGRNLSLQKSEEISEVFGTCALSHVDRSRDQLYH